MNSELKGKEKIIMKALYESNCDQRMTYYKGTLIGKLEKMKMTPNNIGDYTAIANNKALDDVLALIRKDE